MTARREWMDEHDAPPTPGELAELDREPRVKPARVVVDGWEVRGGTPAHDLHDHGDAALTGLRLKRNEER